MAKKNDQPKKKDQTEEYSCRKRVYPNKTQYQALSNYLYVAQKFRNLAVVFCEERRKERAQFVKKHPALSRDWIPEEFSGDDVLVCSKELTKELNWAKDKIKILWGLNPSQKDFSETLRNHLQQLSKEEQAEIPFALFLTVHRTVLDQVLQDLDKTYKKAKKDRIEKKKKKAGFPQTRKHQFCSGVRFQVSSKKNKTYLEHWQAGFIFVPSIGLLKFRDTQTLPETPPEMITVSRNASGQFHVSFLDKDTSNAQKTWQDLPMETIQDKNGKTKQVPSIDGVDLGLTTLGTTTKKEIARKRYTRMYAKALRKANKSLARKQKGSSRWHKAKCHLGQVHVKIANCRQDNLRKEAKKLVQESAILCMEDLSLQFMLQNSHLSQSAYDCSLGQFKTYIYAQARKMGHLVLECGRFDPSSKTCSQCNYYYKELTLKDTSWTCQGCDTFLLRDKNAAINIRLMALQKAIETLTASGNDVGALSSYKLHPKLVTFIKRGGLTAMLKAFTRFNTSHTDEPLVLPQKTLSK